MSSTTLRRRSAASGCRATKPLRLEPVEQADHRRAVDPETCGRLLLGLGLATVQQQQDGQLPGVDAGRGEVLRVQVLELDEGALEQVVEPAAELRPELGLTGHPPERTARLIVSITDNQ